MAGCLLAALTYFPIFQGLTHYANPAIETASQTNPVVVIGRSGDLQLPVRSGRQEGVHELLRHHQERAGQGGVPYTNEAAPAGTVASVQGRRHDDRLVRGRRARRRMRSRPSPRHSASS